MLDHVREQQVLTGGAERCERDGDDDEAGIEAGLAPAGDRSVLQCEGTNAPRVQHADERERAELEGVGEVGRDGEWEGEHASGGYGLGRS